MARLKLASALALLALVAGCKPTQDAARASATSSGSTSNTHDSARTSAALSSTAATSERSTEAQVQAQRAADGCVARGPGADFHALTKFATSSALRQLPPRELKGKFADFCIEVQEVNKDDSEWTFEGSAVSGTWHKISVSFFQQESGAHVLSKFVLETGNKPAPEVHAQLVAAVGAVMGEAAWKNGETGDDVAMGWPIANSTFELAVSRDTDAGVSLTVYEPTED